ncbi:MAG: PAS-domain containing protein [Pseudomonadota bacterium]
MFDLLTIILLIMAAIAAVAGYRAIALSHSLAHERRRVADLTAGIVFRAEGERILDLSREATRLTGAVTGTSLREVLGEQLADGREEALSAVDQLIDRGQPMRLLVSDRSGAPYELSGRPKGGELIVTLSDASLMVTELRKSQARILARERALELGGHERRTMSALLDAGAAIAWQRAADGSIAWSAGSVATRQGNVSATQTTQLLRARPGDAEPDETGIVRTRLEILPAGAIEPLPLQVIEAPSEGGGASGLATDATVAAQAERTLGRFVQTMTETFAHLTAGLAIFSPEQKLVLFNPALAQLLQLDPAWLANRPSLRDVIDALRANRRAPETGDFHGWRARILALFDQPERADFDEVWHLADGTNIKVLARPHPHGSLAFVFDDISDRVRLEQRFRQSIDLQEATLDRLEEGLAVFGTDGRLQIVNDAFNRIFGTDEQTVYPGRHAREIVQLCRDLTVETEVWDRVTGFITSEETRGAWSERLTLGSNRTLRIRLAPLPGGATMMMAIDITDSERFAEALRERNSALESAEEMRTAVLDQVSHRLRTPLNTIFGFGQLLNDPRFGHLTERQREYAAGILEASGQLLDTIDEVTDLASLQPGDRPDTGGDPGLDDAVELARSLLEKRAGEAGVTLRADLGTENVAVVCNPSTLRQIVFNMAAGALHRALPGSTVQITTSIPREDRVALSVTERPRATPSSEAEDRRSEADQATAALQLTGRMVEAEGGTFSYGPSRPAPGATRGGGAAIGEMCAVATFKISGETMGLDTAPIPTALRS